MNKTVSSIVQRLSLRKPQAEALERLAWVADAIPLKKGADVAAALATVRAKYPSVASFERDFASLCFALATGVGKTRLMGAFIAYLHKEKGIRHFFVLAPNLTIYDKLIADFTPGTPKYVFQGLADFATQPPLVITGDNYENQRVVRSVAGATAQLGLYDDTVHINVFNISKLNAEVRGGKAPRIKRLSEYIGQSYFDYLAGLDDLVLLMDESHRYRAAAGVRVLNELAPVLGLELTATPQVETARGAVPFENVVYPYSLGEAIDDGFVKEPAVATRKDFHAADYAGQPERLERLKLEDGVRLHETVKVELEVYARNAGEPVVKPFMLVIAREVEHAKSLQALLESPEFCGGRYAGKVITVHSGQQGEEKDETVQRLLAVERRDEPTEIVVHVNMLKEGWDVTNLYTIVPLRPANTRTLIEQSIGRGLRLPYGKRVGVMAVDRLTIVAHDKFQEIIDEANKEDSPLRQRFKTVIVDEEPGVTTVVVPSVVDLVTSTYADGADVRLVEETPGAKPVDVKEVAAAAPQAKPQASAEEAQIGRAVMAAIQQATRDPKVYPTPSALLAPAPFAGIRDSVVERLPPAQQALPGLEAAVRRGVEQFVALTLAVPRIVVVPKGEVTCGYADFDLDCTNLGYGPIEESIVREAMLRGGTRETIGVAALGPDENRPEDYVLRGVLEHDDIAYDPNAELLNKLASQAVAHLRARLKDEGALLNVVKFHQSGIAALIHAQMQPHFWQRATEFEARVSQGFEVPRPVSYKVPAESRPQHFREPPVDRSAMRSMLFHGFKKCIYPYQRFDVEPERRMAVVLEDDGDVKKWMKPASGVFRIDYAKGSAYEPDFVAETKDKKLMIEVKRASDLADEDVVAKARAAVTWCKYATQHEQAAEGKQWLYLLVPHDAIDAAQSVAGMIARYTQGER
jgi:type III restriction enzyme